RGVKVECLFARMRNEPWREYRTQAAPLLIVFVPWRQFLDLHVRLCKHERRCEIIPNGQAAKEDKTQLVPLCLPGFAAKRSAGIIPRSEGVSLRVFDRPPARFIETGFARIGKSSEPY